MVKFTRSSGGNEALTFELSRLTSAVADSCCHHFGAFRPRFRRKKLRSLRLARHGMIRQQLGQKILLIFEGCDHFLRRRLHGESLRRLVQGKTPRENHHPNRRQTRPNATTRPDHFPPPFTKGHCWSEPANGFRPAGRLNRPGPASLDGLPWLKVRKSFCPVRERHRHGLDLLVICAAIRARREVVFNLVPLRFRQRAADQKAEALAIAPAWIEKPFHICLSPFTSERFIFILRIFSKA